MKNILKKTFNIYLNNERYSSQHQWHTLLFNYVTSVESSKFY